MLSLVTVGYTIVCYASLNDPIRLVFSALNLAPLTAIFLCSFAYFRFSSSERAPALVMSNVGLKFKIGLVSQNIVKVLFEHHFHSIGNALVVPIKQTITHRIGGDKKYYN